MAEKKDIKAQLKQQRERDNKKVKGIFRFHEVPGGSIKFPYKKYKEDPTEIFEMKDGEVYTIPLGVAEHLNKHCYHEVHEHCMDKDGNPITRVGRKIQRCGFQSLEFTLEEDLKEVGSAIYTPDRVVL